MNACTHFPKTEKSLHSYKWKLNGNAWKLPIESKFGCLNLEPFYSMFLYNRGGAGCRTCGWKVSEREGADIGL